MRIRHGIALAAAALTAIALTGCTGGAATSADSAGGSGNQKITGTITFQTWALKNAQFTPYFTSLISGFEKKHPGTHVKWIDQPADGYEDKILQQAQADQLPDVMNITAGMAYQLQKAGLVRDLKKADPGVLDTFVPGGVKAYTYPGVSGVYGYPWYLGTDLNYWNMGQLKKAGLGVDDLPHTLAQNLDFAKKAATSPAKIPVISQVPSPRDLLIAAGVKDPAKAIYSHGKFTFKTPGTVKALQKYADLYKVGGISPDALQGAGTANTNIDNFNRGTVAWTSATPNYIEKNLAVNAPKLLPDIHVTNTFGTPSLFVQGVSLAAHSKNPATALAFAQYLTDNENQVAFVKLAVGFFPGTKKGNADPSSFADKSEHAQQNEATKLAAAQMSSAQVPTPLQFTDTMESYAKQQFALAIKGKTTPAKALQAAVEYCDQNVSK